MGPTRVCSLAGDTAVNATAPDLNRTPADGVSTTLMKGGNMTGNTLMQEPVDATERLIKYLVAVVERTYNLRLKFARVVVDFIKDEDGKWWFTQIKNFELDTKCAPEIRAWNMGTLEEPKWGRPSFDTPARGGHDGDSDDAADFGGGGGGGGGGSGGGGGGSGGGGGGGGSGGKGHHHHHNHRRPYGSTMPTQPDQTPASKGGKCELCGLWFKLSDCVIDAHGVDVPAFGYKVFICGCLALKALTLTQKTKTQH